MDYSEKWFQDLSMREKISFVSWDGHGKEDKELTEEDLVKWAEWAYGERKAIQQKENQAIADRARKIIESWPQWKQNHAKEYSKHIFGI